MAKKVLDAQVGGMAAHDNSERDFTVVPSHPLTDLAVTIDRLQRRVVSSYMTDTDRCAVVRDTLPVLRALLEALTQAPMAWTDIGTLNRYRQAVQADRIAAVLLLEKKESD